MKTQTPCPTNRRSLSWLAPFFLSALLLGGMGLGCNTSEGVQEDVEDAADAVEDGLDDAADAVKDATN